MAVVKANGVERVYPEGTTYLEIAKDFEDQYENDILLVRVNGKLRELDKKLTEDSEISFLTAKDSAGYKTYERSAIFLRSFRGRRSGRSRLILHLETEFTVSSREMFQSVRRCSRM